MNKMKKTSTERLYFLLAALLVPTLLGALAQAKDVVRVYPAPAGEPMSRMFKVSVENQNVPVYLARVMGMAAVNPELRMTGQASFASFDMDAPVTVGVDFPEPIMRVKILPTSAGITSDFVSVKGKEIRHFSFTVSKPGPLTIEIDGDWMNSLQLFINPFEKDAPNPKDPNVIYIGPGVHVITTLKVGSGKTVYLAGGAIVYGKITPESPTGPILALEGNNITVRGRGILDGSLMPRPGTPNGHIITAQGMNLHFEGIILRDSCTWNLVIRGSGKVDVKNVKIFGWRGSSDGIDIDSSSNVNVSDSFVRTWDDLIVIKASESDSGGSHDITVEHNVLWNEKAHALSIGAEIRGKVSNVLFSDNDIIHDKGDAWLLRVFDGDSGTVKHVIFDNIRIEESRRMISLWLGKTPWSKDTERGHIDDITFRDITSVLPEPKGGAVAQFKAFDDKHGIGNVKFENVQIGGKPFQQADVEQNEFVHNVTITP